MKEQCCFETSFKNAEPQEDTFCGCHEDYDFDWDKAEHVEDTQTELEEVSQDDCCDCEKESLMDTQTKLNEKNDEYDIVDI